MKARSGHTIIETLVAMTVAAAAVVLGYTIFAATLDARLHTTARAQATLRAAVLREQLTEWLSNAHTPLDNMRQRFVLLDSNRDGRGDDLTFITRRAYPVHEGPAEIRLRWVGEVGSEALLAEIRSMSGEPLDSITVSPWVAAFQVRLLGDDGQWLSHWNSAVTLPAAVEFTVRTANRDSLAALVELPLVVRLYTTQ